MTAQAEPVLPEGWKWDRDAGKPVIQIASHKDGAARLMFSIPENTLPGRYIVPFRITWNGKYLGQIRHAVIEVI